MPDFKVGTSAKIGLKLEKAQFLKAMKGDLVPES